MDITVYLPDEIGKRARAAELPFSRLFRAAVEAELHRRNTVSQTLANAKVHEVEVESENGGIYVGRITGEIVALEGWLHVYLTDDERVIVYDEEQRRYSVVQDLETELRQISQEAYIEVMSRLGERPVVDL